MSGTAFGKFKAAAGPRSFIAYLDTAAGQFKDLKRLSFARLELKPGDTVLEVGCGTGDDLRELAALVGKDGLAIGIDSSRAMIAEARKRAGGSGLEVEFIVGDAERIDLAQDSFNACRADRVLQHVSDPAQALREMVRVANPGGTVQAIDRDWGLVAVDAADRPTTRAILDRACDGIRNGWIGRQLPALFAECGLKSVLTSVVPVMANDFPIANAMLDLETVARKAREEHVVAPQAAANWLRDLRDRHKRKRFFACWAMLIVTGRKPR